MEGLHLSSCNVTSPFNSRHQGEPVGFHIDRSGYLIRGRLLKRELKARELSANRLALDLGIRSGRITDILNGRRSVTADTAVQLGRYFGNRAQFWLDLQSQHDIAVIERKRGAEIARRVRPTNAA